MPHTPQPARKKRRGGYFASLPPDERSDLARAAANARWAKVADREAATRAAREAQHAEFYAEADRQGVTDPEVREAMARNAERAWMGRMTLARKRQARLAREAREAQARDAAAGGEVAV
jgi:hypothetical protein